MSSHEKHLTVSGEALNRLYCFCVPIEIDTLGHSCDVVKHGNLLRTASIRFLLNVLISRRRSQIIASLTRETLAEREAEITNLPWKQIEKTLL